MVKWMYELLGAVCGLSYRNTSDFHVTLSSREPGQFDGVNSPDQQKSISGPQHDLLCFSRFPFESMFAMEHPSFVRPRFH
jgi:hypothetical protein